MLNGNVEGDLEGHITHPGLSNQEEAVLDYGGANSLVLMEIESFTVEDENASDYFPIVVSLMSYVQARDEEWVTVRKWNRFTKEDYKAGCNQDDCGRVEVY